jgi:hypothetical protein
LAGSAEFTFGEAFAFLSFKGHEVVGVEGDTPEGGKIGGCVAVSGLIVVFSADRIQHPVAAVFDAPVARVSVILCK